MRDIKFRAYIKDTNKRVPSEINKIVEVKSLHLGSRKAIIGYSKSSSNYGNYSISFDDIELMQYTGLHDKNGEEIYEGDIVYVASEDENAFILWDKETARYIIQFKGWCADFDNYYGKELEIIGDIYNNPELLGGE